MGIVNKQNLDNAATTFRAAFEQFFTGEPEGIAPLFTEMVPNDGLYFENDIVASFPAVREWVGPKVFKEMRAYKQTLTVTKYEKSTQLDRMQVAYGAPSVTRALQNFVQRYRFWYDEIIIPKLVANSWTSYDGVTLLNNSHPHVHSDFNADNLYTDDLSFTVHNTIISNMKLVADEDGTPLGVTPTHLLVGPLQERTAKEVTGSTRLASMSNTGGVDATSGVVATGELPNYVGGDLAVIVSPKITGNQYFYMDLSKPGLRPCGFAENRAPEPVEMMSMDDHDRFHLDKFSVSIESDGVAFAGLWQLIAGRVAA